MHAPRPRAAVVLVHGHKDGACGAQQATMVQERAPLPCLRRTRKGEQSLRAEWCVSSHGGIPMIMMMTAITGACHTEGNEHDSSSSSCTALATHCMEGAPALLFCFLQ